MIHGVSAKRFLRDLYGAISDDNVYSGQGKRKGEKREGERLGEPEPAR